MRLTTKRELGLVLADLVRQVLLSPLELRSTDDIARGCGYSRFHLTRVFMELTGEPLAGFMRRIRLERAACRIRTGESAADAAIAAGFESPEAFSRAFKRAYGLSPRKFKQTLVDWQLASPEGLHWNFQWDDTYDGGILRARFETTIDRSGPLRIAAISHVGNYGRLWEGWEKVPFVEGKSWVTVYHDSMWTCPRRDLMRAELGFILGSGAAPKGFHVFELPSGLTVKSMRFVERKERNDAWSFLSGAWPNHQWGWDEYESWPLPFEQVRTRICMRVGDS